MGGMGRRSEPETVVDATADRDALRPLLEEYHDWLRTGHREWADRTAAADVALASEANIADGAADDLRSPIRRSTRGRLSPATRKSPPDACSTTRVGGDGRDEAPVRAPARRGDGLGRALVAALVDATAAIGGVSA